MKVAHANSAREMGSGKTKVISVYPGQFLEYLFGAGVRTLFHSPLRQANVCALRSKALVGLDTVNRTYTVAGQPNNKFSNTSTADVGSALVRLSLLAIENPGSVPDHIRLSGDAVSIAGLAKIVGDERGETIEVKTTDAAETKQKFIDNPADLLSLVK